MWENVFKSNKDFQRIVQLLEKLYLSIKDEQATWRTNLLQF